MSSRQLLLLWTASLACPALADEPLEPAASWRIESGSAACWAVSDAGKNVTTAFRRVRGQTRKAWEVAGWFRVAALAPDCEHLVAGYDGVNLLPADYAASTVMLSFYRKGQLLRQLTLSDLVKDLGALERTASHWSWGHYVGVERRWFYRVWTRDRGELVFDMRSGLLAE